MTYLAVTLADITPSQVIELLVFILAVIGIFIKLSKDRSDVEVKLNTSNLKILDLETRYAEMNERITRTQTNFFSALAELKKENREDHGKVFDKLTEVGESLSNIVAYVNYESAGKNSNDRKRDARKKIKEDEA